MHVHDDAAPAEARRALEWFQNVADAAPMSIWISDIDKQPKYFNKRWLEFTGRTLEQERGVGWSNVVHPDDFERCMRTYQEAFDARRDFELECRTRRHDGLYRWVLGRGNPMWAGDGTFLGFIGTCIDVTERKEAEAQRERQLVESVSQHAAELARLSEEQLDIIERVRRLRSQRDAEVGRVLLEEERRRIARDLHDNVEQTFFAIGLAAKAALVNPPTDRSNEVVETLTRVSELAAAGVERLREAIFALNHAEIVGRGLAPALWKLASDFHQRTAVDADVVVTGSQRRLPTDVAETLYATAREALANVERHSNAGAVILGLHITGHTVTLSIQDDGTGASPAAPEHIANSAACFGLHSVGERVGDLNGSFAAGPNPDGGFQVRARLPLRERRGQG